MQTLRKAFRPYMKPPDINKYNLKSAVNVFASLSQKYKNIWKKPKMPSYSNIFLPETSFRTQIVDLENEDKKICLIALVISSFFPMPESNCKYRMRDCQDFSTIRYRLPQLKFLSSNPDRRTICPFKIIQISLLRMFFNIFVPSIT